MKIRIINRSSNQSPQYATEGASGMDLRASLDSNCTILPMQRLAIPTGLYIEIPKDYEAQVRSRSGLALKHGLIVINSPGTIDSDYRGEIKVILINLSDTPATIYNGDRIAQMIITPYTKVECIEVETLEHTTRDTKGFGSTGIA